MTTANATQTRRSLHDLTGSLLATRNDLALTIARVALGAIMLPHGLQKTLGMFGGYGFSATVDYFQSKLGIAPVLSIPAILLESVGALLLIAGLGSRIWAAGLAVVMGVAATQHLKFGFFSNWLGNQAGEGVEFHLLAIGIALVVLISGSGAASLDGILQRNRD